MRLVAVEDYRYDGEFVNGKREGRGRLMYTVGDYYEGEWVNNLFHGNGIFATADFNAAVLPHRGCRYEGKYEYGQRHGFGLFHASDGAIYEGYFEENLLARRGLVVLK